MLFLQQLAVELLQEIPKGLVVEDVVRELNSRQNGEKLLSTALAEGRLDADVAKDAIVIDHGAVLKNEGLEFEYRVIGC